MVYYTIRQSPAFHQISLEELLFPDENVKIPYMTYDPSSTKTYEVEKISEKALSKVDIASLVLKLCEFNASTKRLKEVERSELYTFYKIPKKSGGLRKISAPEPELMEALRKLKTILEHDFGALYHTSAFAYIEKRSIVSAMKKHQSNTSHWFAKFDLHDFFGSTTLDFAMKQLGMIFPFSEVCKSDVGKTALREAIELGFLDGGLPQGTPLSPTLTNILMIPIDYKLSKALRSFEDRRLIYTRYADDFIISGKDPFKWIEVQNLIVNTLAEFDAPFELNRKKSRYGSNTGSGANWNLGLMLNADNKITVGSKRKKVLKTTLTLYVKDKKRGIAWSIDDIQHILGEYSFLQMVEGRESARKFVNGIIDKVGLDPIKSMKEDLKI